MFEIPPQPLYGADPTSSASVANTTVPQFFVNKRSTARIGGFNFRNPTQFMDVAEESIRDAEYETEANLHHIFWHKNTAPFIAYRLIQRFSTSNPSPRFVRAVSEAFRTGECNGQVYSGEYGDLGSTIACVLLDREARSTSLDLDPIHGVMREPLLKVLHLMRSMDYVPEGGHDVREIELKAMTDRIGMQAHDSPSVFNFYEWNFQPNGMIADAGLVSPEAGLGNTPLMLGFLNGVRSLVSNGLLHPNCDDKSAFGSSKYGGSCTKQGDITWTPSADASDVAGVVDELELLLIPSGRLADSNRDLVERAYAAALAEGSSEREALAVALQLVATLGEFHTSAANVLDTEAPRTPAEPEVEFQGREYKAVIVLYLQGGADSYNMLVPHSGCDVGAATSGVDVRQQYEDIRGQFALDADELLPIQSDDGSQPCSTFGLHEEMETVQALYEDGDATMVANIGNLVETMTSAEYNDRSGRRPSGIFAHNTQTMHAHTVYAASPKGTYGMLGRMVDSITGKTYEYDATGQPYRANSYSLAGTTKILDGETHAETLSPTDGNIKFLMADDPDLGDYVENTTDHHSHSYMAETYTSLFDLSATRSAELSAVLDHTETMTEFAQDTNTNRAFHQASRIIKARNELESERDVFYLSLGSFDHHTNLPAALKSKLSDMDDAIGAFVGEMKAQGMWDNVTIVTASEFGRTLDGNGFGSDHGWGGNHMVLGGSVAGGTIKGEYPTDLSEDTGVLNIGRGRIIPTTSWEAVWNGVAQWFGVEEADMDDVLPGRASFAAAANRLFTEADLFETA